MATDVCTLHTENHELAGALANIQRAMDQMQQQHALLIQALVNATRGRWDAARFGPQSVESLLVALDPSLQGKVRTDPFDQDQ